MKKFFIILAVGLLFVACASNESSTSEVAAPSLIAEKVFFGHLCYNLYDDKTAEVVNDDSYSTSLSGELTIPSIIEYNSENYNVTKIGDNSFLNCSGLTYVSIPNSVTNVGYNVFSECRSLRKPVYNEHIFVRLPVSYEGAYAVPRGITQITGGAFSRCMNLTTVTLPNTVTSIGRLAFFRCYGLTSINIPNGVTHIGNDAFALCYNLTSVNIPNGVTSIEYRVFCHCESLTSVTIPNSVTSIKERAFSGCTGLRSITIPKNVTSIADDAFNGCTNLQIIYEE